MREIKDNYPDLTKYDISEQFDEVKPPKEMVELIKEWIPIHACVGTVWGKSKPIEQREQTEDLSEKCKQLKKRIFEFDFYGSITFVVNGIPVILQIYFDEDSQEKDYKWVETTVVNLDFKWIK